MEGEVEKYKSWPIYKIMPGGWVVDRSAGSPLAGHEFITNGKSVLNGQQRALLQVKSNTGLPVVNKHTKSVDKPIHNECKSAQVIDKKYMRTVNDLARKTMQKHILNDIRLDLAICDIEGWDKLEYIEELKILITSICVEGVAAQMRF